MAVEEKMDPNTPSTDIAWVAGWLEGEGCFGVDGYSPFILSGCKDKDVVEKFARIVGGSTTIYQSGGIWTYRINGRLAISWMRALLPWMGERRAGKIREALEISQTGRSQAAAKRREDKLTSKIGTYCKKGHLLEGKNALVHEQRGKRYLLCRECRNSWQRDYNEKKRGIVQTMKDSSDTQVQ